MVNITLSNVLKDALVKNGVDPDVDYVPAYGGESAGLDLYNAGESITIEPSYHNSLTRENSEKFKVLVPTGLKIQVPKGYVALIQERGSVTKTPLKVRAGVIDCGYTGEIFINCINTSCNAYNIYKHQKLPFQVVVVKCDNSFNVISEEEYLDLTTNSIRKEGQVGSSD